MQTSHHTTVLLLTGLASAFLFGAATPASKALLTGTGAQVLAGFLYLGAALGVMPFAVRKDSFQPPWRMGRRTIFMLSGAVVLGGIVGPLLLLLGLKVASSGSVSLWLNLEFVATVFLGHFVFREHMTARGWLAAGGTLFAALLLAGGEGDFGILSVCLVAAACLCWGFDNHFTALIDGITPVQITFWKGLVAGAFNLIVGAAMGSEVGSLSLAFIALIVGAASYGASVTLYIIAAQGLGPSRSQMIFSLAPFFGLMLSVVILGEVFTGTQALAGLIMAASLGLLFTEKHRHFHLHEFISHQHGHIHGDGHHDHNHDDLRATEGHAHWHEHAPQEHTHAHWPDLHHRHNHQEGEEAGHLENSDSKKDK